MLEEVYQTLAHLLREYLSLRRLLKSDFVLIKGLLANYCGLDGVTGDAFRKVTLGIAAILAFGGNDWTANLRCSRKQRKSPVDCPTCAS